MTQIIGNEPLQQVFSSLIKEGRLHHCYLFEGPKGVGKATLATKIIKRVNCMSSELSEDSLEACQKCWSCQMIDIQEHPDVLTVGLDPERTAPIISVRQARDIISKVELPPFRAPKRFVVIDPADAMKDEASNALLKTFEEPPDQTHFILITESAHRLLPTIRSRSQRVRFQPCSETELMKWLDTQGCTETQLTARLAAGCPGKSKELMSGALNDWMMVRSELVEVLQESAEYRFRYAQGLTRGNREKWLPYYMLCLDVLQSLCRDALCILSGRADEIINLDIQSFILRWSERISMERTYFLYSEVERLRRDLEIYINSRLLLDELLSLFSDAWRGYAY